MSKNLPSDKDHWNYKHGEGKVGRRSKEWRAWNAMIRRCYYPSMERYPRYGGRGIKVCDRWRRDFLTFLSDVGRAPSEDHQLNRIDNDGHYEPGNVEWATRSENIRNSAKARWIEFDGRRMVLTDWAAETGINRRTIAARLDVQGWTVEQALTTPVLRRS